MENLQDWIIVIAFALVGGLWERIKAGKKKSAAAVNDPGQTETVRYTMLPLSVASPHKERNDRRKELPPEGECAIPHLHAPLHTEDPSVESGDSLPVNPEREAALAAHYARWRQAFLDAQVLPPKFKD